MQTKNSCLNSFREIRLQSSNFNQDSNKKPHFGLKRVTSRDPYQSIDLIVYYKSYDRHKELGRGRQALEGTKGIFSFRFFTIFKEFSD
jgi:hypothetical protein